MVTTSPSAAKLRKGSWKSRARPKSAIFSVPASGPLSVKRIFGGLSYRHGDGGGDNCDGSDTVAMAMEMVMTMAMAMETVVMTVAMAMKLVMVLAMEMVVMAMVMAMEMLLLTSLCMIQFSCKNTMPFSNCHSIDLTILDSILVWILR